ncbi:MAG: siroheme synthase [Fluviicola sp.]|jgi:siroheme synthase-like protein|uniref:TSUP family transporter n=1 Tax=Fluviicola sp. TaxID=1917219 RepID=UPI0026375C18|nr:TSUP family transporter [Fluviicola sp.]MDF3025908.1 siroheme synthase [Fluviicola sp.]
MREANTNELFPIFLKTQELNVLLVGGGEVALEKLKALLVNSPDTPVSVVAREYSDAFIDFAERHESVFLEVRNFKPSDIEGKQLIITALNDVETSEYIMNLASDSGILYNAADKPELCNFYLGSVVRKGHLKIGISTNGRSPTLAKRLKEILDENLPLELNDSALQLNEFRNYLKGDFKQKVKKMNQATAALLVKADSPWYFFSLRKLSLYLLGIIGVMLTGHLLFTLIPLESIWNSASAAIDSLTIDFAYFVLAGFIAQMIDGALGMAYGVSATTFLLSYGITPAVSSMAVHASEIFTSGVSGIMHLRFGNVNNRLFRSILIPGVLGAIVGAYVLTEFESYNDIIKPIVSAYTLFLGGLIIYKVLRKKQARKKVTKVGWLGLLGGFLDSIGGGGWGPVVSSTLIARGKHPRMIVGSVNLAEFFVSLASSFTFFTVIGTSNVWQPLAGLVLGGVCAAPIAAYLASKLNIKAMMLFVGIVVVIVSLRNFLTLIF